MTISALHPRELELLNLVGLSLYRLISKARFLKRRRERAAGRAEIAAQEWSEETAIGYEAGWMDVRQSK